VASELRRLRSQHGTALLLISHEPEVVALLMGPEEAAEGQAAEAAAAAAKGGKGGKGGPGPSGEGSTLVGGGGAGRGRGGTPQSESWAFTNSVVTLAPAAKLVEGSDEHRALFGGTSLAQRFGLKVGVTVVHM
jgi:hypothetical protein